MTDTAPAPLPEQRAGFTGELWREIAPTYAAILAHPFLRGVVDGTLPPERFRAFVIQDSHYLQGFARGLALTAARGRDGDEVGLFTTSSATAIAVERSLHASFLADFGLDDAAVAATPRNPTTTAYVDFVLANTALGSFVEGLASVLACYWIYWEVGHTLIAEGSPDPRYQRWIDTYGSQQFGATVTAVLQIVDSVGAEASDAQRARARELFATGARYEWRFWDAAWREETWPV